MKIVGGGLGGLIGTRLVEKFESRGDTVLRLVRPSSQTGPGEETIEWDPAKGNIQPSELEGTDVVIALGGANIAGKPWTEAYKKVLWDSRIKPTRLLSRTLAELKEPPPVFLCASAIGFYGHRGDQLMDESQPRGSGFLSDLAGAWEEATESAAKAGIRVVNLRFGVVLSKEGGALAKMLTPFKLGLGGRVGSGNQYMSWIGLEDAVETILFCMANPAITGPVNLVAPEPVTNGVFTKTLGEVLKRPTVMPLPKWAARLAMGKMADDLLLGSTRVACTKLEGAGYQFRFPRLKEALRYHLK